MSLENMMAAFDKVAYAPRTLELNLPDNLTQNLSVHGRAFLEIAYDKPGLTVLELTNGNWKDDQTALNFFFRGEADERLEILAFLTLFIHEYTHRIDFLISPFGLQYYGNTLREYWLMQEFVPPILDDPKTIERMRFLVGFSEKGPPKQAEVGIWEPLEQLIHLSYAWGDVSGVKPLGKYIEKGWNSSFLDSGDPFGVGVSLEPVTVLKIFHTFRLPGGDRLWYLRPLTIFETKAVVNSLLFILHVLGERGPEACADYYERLYLNRKDQLPRDYFFLLDLGAGIYGLEDFYALLKTGHTVMIRSTLLMLSSICWFALQAPPPLKDEDPRVANPIFRLLLAFNFLSAYARGQLNVAFNSTEEGLLMLDGSKNAAALFVKPIKDTVPDCVRIIDSMIELNEVRTWNPEVKKHFRHIFKLMRPHFSERKPSYRSLLGMPASGSPLLECRTKDDWELTYEDYQAPAEVKDWFSIRADLFFNLLKPADEILNRLDAHYLAFLFPYLCECGGLTMQWVSRFAEEYQVMCNYCQRTKIVHRDETRVHVVKREE